MVEYIARQSYDDTPVQRSRFNDVGMFYAAAVSNTSNLAMGELYVRYTVQLSKAQVNAREITRYLNAYSRLTEPFTYFFSSGEFYLRTTIPSYVGISPTPDRLYFSTAFSKYLVILRVRLAPGGTMLANPGLNASGGLFIDGTLVSSRNDADDQALVIATVTCKSAGGFLQLLAPTISPGSSIASWNLDIFPQGDLSFAQWASPFVS